MFILRAKTLYYASGNMYKGGQRHIKNTYFIRRILDNFTLTTGLNTTQIGVQSFSSRFFYREKPSKTLCNQNKSMKRGYRAFLSLSCVINICTHICSLIKRHSVCIYIFIHKCLCRYTCSLYNYYIYNIIQNHLKIREKRKQS